MNRAVRWILATKAGRVATLDSATSLYWTICVGSQCAAARGERAAKLMARRMLLKSELDPARPGKCVDDYRTGKWRKSGSGAPCCRCHRENVETYDDLAMGVCCLNHKTCEALRLLWKLNEDELAEVLRDVES